MRHPGRIIPVMTTKAHAFEPPRCATCWDWVKPADARRTRTPGLWWHTHAPLIKRRER